MTSSRFSESIPPKRNIERLNSADSKWPLFNFNEIWQYREMLTFLVTRDIKSRYRQTVIGIFWTLINPFITMILFTFVFGNLAGVPSYNVPYPIFSFAALVPWAFFYRALTVIPISLVSNTQLVTKVAFPRVLIPLAALLTAFVDFFAAFIMLVIMLILFRIVPRIDAVIWIPYFTLLTVMTAFGAGLWFAALNIQVRDINYIVPYLLQALQFLSPIAYSGNMVKGSWRFLYELNPLAAICDGFRWALLNIDTFQPSMVFIPTVSALIILISGYVFFRRKEPNFADFI
jgi:lipopolysaccharide transport system permease protein